MTPSTKLLNWFKINGRELPWRHKGGAHPNPYAVWISEIMLCQTTVATVIPYYLRWMERFPNIKTLAEADIQEVLNLWQGLGYYTRARKIHECAKLITEKYHSQLPSNRETLLKLPGIGPYTASSICCFAFNKNETVCDGNVHRIICRLIGENMSKDQAYQKALQLTPRKNGADYASAIMDLGATVCTPKNPKCSLCPWNDYCIAFQKNIQSKLPQIIKTPKKSEHGNVYLIFNPLNQILIRKNEEAKLLKGLWEFPWSLNELNFNAYKTNRTVRHIFTHIDMKLDIWIGKATNEKGTFIPLHQINRYPMSNLMKKVLQTAIPELPEPKPDDILS